MRFSEADYFAREGTDQEVAVSIIKDNMRLANPIVLQVTPLTADRALDMGIIASFSPEESRSANQLSYSPLRASK